MRYTCRPIHVYPTVKSFNTVAEVEVALGPWLSMSKFTVDDGSGQSKVNS